MAENVQQDSAKEKTKEVFNWATERSTKDEKKVDEIIKVYRQIWLTILSSDNPTKEEIDKLNAEFDSFYAVCKAEEGLEKVGEGQYKSTNHFTGKEKAEKTHFRIRSGESTIKINGTTFQDELKRRLALNSELSAKYKEIDDEKEFTKFIGARALEKFAKTANVSGDLVDNLANTYFAQMSVSGFFPFDTVTTAGYAVATGKNLQMGCGEGKTGVLVYATAANIAEGKQVFLTSSTVELAFDTLKDTAAIYDCMGLNSNEKSDRSSIVLISKDKVTYARGAKSKMTVVSEISLKDKTPEEIAKILTEAYSKSIVVADNATVMNHQMRGLIPKKDPASRVLLADEADYVLLDQYRPSQLLGREYSPKANEFRTNLRIQAMLLLDSFTAQNPGSFTKDDKNMYVDFTPSGREELKNFITSNFAQVKNNMMDSNGKLAFALDMQQLFDFMYEALVVREVYKENRDYQISYDADGKMKIISEDRASGSEIDLPQGISQALAVRVKARNPEKYKAIEIETEREVLTATNCKQVYENLVGLKCDISGTLTTSDSAIQAQEMGYTDETAYNIPARDVNARVYNPKRLFRNAADRRRGVIKEAMSNAVRGGEFQNRKVPKIDDNAQPIKDENGNVIKEERSVYVSFARPVIIGCVSDEEVNDMVADLKAEVGDSKLPRIIDCTAASSDRFQHLREQMLIEMAQVNGMELSVAEIRDTTKEGKANLNAKLDQLSKSVKLGNPQPGNFMDVYGISPFDQRAENFGNYIKEYCGQADSNCIVVGTSIIGRGTTIKIDDIAKENAGIHVIINGLHETSSRNQLQYAARTARGQDPGSVDEMMSLDELLEVVKPEYLVELGISYNPETGVLDGIEINENGEVVNGQSKIDNLYKNFYKEVDDRQSIVRTHNENLITHIQSAERNIEEVMRQRLGRQNVPVAEIESRIMIAKSLLSQRAFSIQNRACGNSENEIAEEYKAEINMFSDMYIHKFSMPDPSKFSITNFVQNMKEIDGLDYSQMANQYFEYDVEREIQIAIKYSQQHGVVLSEENLPAIIKGSGVTSSEISQDWSIMTVALQQYRQEHGLDFDGSEFEAG